jgi:hypothetical protein
MAPDATNPARGEAPGLGKLSFPGGIDNRDNSPPSLVAQLKIAPLQQDFAAGLSRATATSCILGVDPGISGAIAFYFPAAPNRVAAEDMPIVASEVDWPRRSGPLSSLWFFTILAAPAARRRLSGRSGQNL